jgi:FkbM family methyltransferase
MKFESRPVANVLVSTEQGSLIVNRFDYHTTSRGHTYGVGFNLLQTSSFDPDEVSGVVELLYIRRKVMGGYLVAIDGGANLGIHTVAWAKAMHNWGEVIAFEPQERIFYLLAGNIALNNCFNACAFNKALGSRIGELNIPVPDYLKPASFGSLELKKKKTNEFIGQELDYRKSHCKTVPVVTIDSLNLARIDFIKLDIEGMEIDALEGSSKTLDCHKPIMLIEHIKVGYESLNSYFQGKGYELMEIGINMLAIHQHDPCLQEIKQWLSEKSYI